MPGMNQLKKFSEDVTNLGNEVVRRQEKHETIPRVAFPENASEADDSDEFVFGLPEQSDTQTTASDSEGGAAAGAENDSSNQSEPEIDIDALLREARGESSQNAETDNAADSAVPDLSAGTGDFVLPGMDGGDALDALADFESEMETGAEEPQIEAPVPEEPAADETQPAENIPSEDILSDFDIAQPDAAAVPDIDDFSLEAPAEDFSLEPPSADAVPDGSDFDIDQPAEDGAAETDDFDFSNTSGEMDFSIPEAEMEFTDEQGSSADSESVNSNAAEKTSSTETEAVSDSAFDIPDIPDVDFSMDAPAADFNTGDASVPAEDSVEDGIDFSLPDFDNNTDNAAPESGVSAENSSGFSIPVDQEPEPGSFEMPPEEDFSFSTDNFTPDGDNADESGDSSGDESGEGDGFEGQDDFSIPGYSDSDFDLISPEEIKTKKQRTSNAGKEKANQEKNKKRTDLTDREYKIFKENLEFYPLNLRIEIQEMILNTDFTEEAIFEVIEKVIKRIPARQLASHLEKLLDKSIPVPINYEKRTAEEYEAYKKSFEYILKNKIIPGVIIGVLSILLLVFCCFLIGRYVVRPVKSEMLYKEGYALIENGLCPQSEEKFNQAEYYMAKKNWFYKYARKYRDKKQFERAVSIYERLIHRYDYEKAAGLEYAHMELDDLANYEKAEQVIRRYVLDRHINDADGMLLLGDVMLEWATNLDSSKFEDARVIYAELIKLYGQTDLYLSRMLRYFIRTDQIREVLPLKNYFYPRLKKNPKKNPLAPQDLIEMSGFLMEKLFGYLPPADEYLRDSIEDVRDMLEKAVEAAPQVPEATYNLGRYFVEKGNPNAAEAILKASLNLFENAEIKNHRRIIKNIDAYRLLGEVYRDNRQYLDAEKNYVSGIELFTQEQDRSGLASDEKVGKLYADMADLDYFISGKLNSALENYMHSVENLNDVPSVRYRIGVIQYAQGDFDKALNSFIKTISEVPEERNVLFALGNTLVLRNSNAAALGYYEKLMDILDLEKEKLGVLFPQIRENHGALVEMYLKASNNLGVTLSRLAKQNGNSEYNARAMVSFSESIRAWDALTRNQETMRRLEGTNLASQNIKYLTVPFSSYEPELYTVLPKVLDGEKVLKQADR